MNHARSFSVNWAILAAALAIFLGAAAPSAWARAPKKYQVTGKVLEVSDDLIVIQKDDEKWELARDAATKVDGQLKVGAKVTLEYRMIATNAEVKADKPANPSKPDKKTAPGK